MAIHIQLDETAPQPLCEEIERDANIKALLVKPIEAYACQAEHLIACAETHAFAQAAQKAFENRLPLCIRPDDIWFCIVQGLATHINLHSESLREQFVSHQGKKRLTVQHTDFRLGTACPWPEVFGAFSTQIGQHVGQALHTQVSARFSTTTPDVTAAYDVCLMDGFQAYFEYVAIVGCAIPEAAPVYGIPSITLLGTQEDWMAMIPRVQAFAQYGLEHWVSTLIPVLQSIADSAAGKINPRFWRSLYRYKSDGRPALLNGWMLTLFPYLYRDPSDKTLIPNPDLEAWRECLEHYRHSDGKLKLATPLPGQDLEVLPSSLASAPVLCMDFATGQQIPLRFIAGMMGVGQDQDTQSLSPAFGWAIIYE